MRIKEKRLEDFTVISIIGDMEAYDAEKFEEKTLEIIKKGEKNIIIDLSKLEYISSSGLRALLNIRDRLLDQGGRLLLASLKEKILRVFKVSKLLDMFEVYKDVDEAVKP